MAFLEFISNFRTEYFDIFFRSISLFGEITILLPILCIIYWCINKKLAYKALFAFFFSGSIIHCAKITFRIPRPWVLNPEFAPVDSALDTATGYSFPSGHTQSSSSVFLTFASGTKNKFLSVFSYIIVVLVLLSRMYLGVHTPLDVFTSLAISAIIVLILRNFTANYSFPRSNKAGLLIIALAYAAGLTLYSLLLVHWNISTLELVGDSIVFACSLAGFAIGAYIENRFINFGTECLSIFTQIIKIVLGVGGILLIKYVFSLIPVSTIIIDGATGFGACIWATCIFPLFIRLVQKKKYSEL